MPQNKLLCAPNGRLYTYSWTTGVKLVNVPEPKSDEEVQSHLLWLVRNGREDEAEHLLDVYCSNKR